jgi:acyl-CoA thioesterase
MLLSQILASMQPANGGWTAIIGEDWSQGRATFGGLVSALGNEAMRRLVPVDRKLRSLQTTFVGPALVPRLGAFLLAAFRCSLGPKVRDPSPVPA